MVMGEQGKCIGSIPNGFTELLKAASLDGTTAASNAHHTLSDIFTSASNWLTALKSWTWHPTAGRHSR